ncbi:MAG TPA: hypothetical protein VGB02_03170 [Pyrinomonadaceae bacterium]|jgi:hypothetical protein
MKTQSLKDEPLKRFLLDDVSEEERQTIEERFLQDDDFFVEMLGVEDELYFDYRQDRLSKTARGVFERKFLKSAEDREKSAFADAFLQATAELAEEKAAAKRKIPESSDSKIWWQSIAAFFNFSNPALQFGFAAASILLFLGLIGFFIQNVRRQDETANLENSRNEQQQEQIIAEKGQQQTQIEQAPEAEKSPKVQNENQVREPEFAKIEPRVNQPPQKTVPQPPKSPAQPPAQQRSIVALVLSPGMLTRSGGEVVNRVTLSPSVRNLQLSLLLKNADDYKSYRAALKTLDDGTQIWTSADLKSQLNAKNKSLAFSIPAKNLQTADYEISLNGITETGKTEEITSYYFSVVKSGVK